MDLVNWNPTAGASYNVPVGSKIYAGDSTGVNPGNLADFANPSVLGTIPTIGQINNSRGVNQVIGAINRRIKMWYSISGIESTTPLSYVTSIGGPVTATQFNDIFLAINAIRVAEGFATYTFPTSEVQTGNPVKGTHVGAMRQALALAGTQTLDPSAFWCYSREWTGTSPPFTQEAYQNNGGLFATYFIGWSNSIGERIGIFFDIPDYATSGFSANYALEGGTDTAAPGVLQIYHYDTNVTPVNTGGFVTYTGSGAAFAYGALDGSIPLTSITGSQFTLSADASAIATKAGAKFEILMATDYELGSSQTYPGVGAYLINAFDQQTLQLNW
jgi:hypothetical protein